MLGMCPPTIWTYGRRVRRDFVRAHRHNAADSKAPKYVGVVSRLRRYSAHVRHVAAHSPVCIPPLKSLPAATGSPLFSLSAICLHAWVAPLTCALCSVGNCKICTFTRAIIALPPPAIFRISALEGQRRGICPCPAGYWLFSGTSTRPCPPGGLCSAAF
jgi:hypothetical protein